MKGRIPIRLEKLQDIFASIINGSGDIRFISTKEETDAPS